MTPGSRGVRATEEGVHLAELIPPIYDPADTSRGEREVFELFRDAEGTGGWTVFHSLDIAEHVRQVEGEADFVVLIPGKGLLCLEVKGHDRIRFHDGLWYYGSVQKGDPRGPFRQARECSYSIRDRLKQRYPHLDIVCWYGVVFPFADFDQQSLEWRRWQVIDANSLRSRPFAAQVEAMLDRAREHLAQTTGWFDPASRSPDDDECQAVIRCLKPDFELSLSPRARAERLEGELKRYTDDQLLALDRMRKSPRVAFDGAAGTGKTVLAIETARRGAIEGRKVLLLCYNRLLSLHLAKELACLAPAVTCDTLHNYMCELTGIDPAGRAGDPGFWSRELPEAAVEKLLEGKGGAFDELVVDEAQDVFHADYLDVLDLSIDGGLEHGRWRLFGDFDHQAIYAGELSLERFLEERGGNASIYQLVVNCRNTPAVVEFSERLSGIELDYAEIRRTALSQPRLSFYERPEEQQPVLQEALAAAWEEGYRGRDLVVLSPRRDEICAAAGMEEPPWRDRLRPLRQLMQEDDGNDGHVGFCTIQAYKGLEAPAVIITDIDDLSGSAARSLLYIGATRALEHLHVIADQGLRQQLQLPPD